MMGNQKKIFNLHSVANLFTKFNHFSFSGRKNIVCIHGYRESSISFSKRIQPLSKLFSEKYSLKPLFPNAPFPLTPNEEKISEDKKIYTWYYSEQVHFKEKEFPREDVKNRLSVETLEYHGFQTSKAFFENFLSQNQDIVAIFAFSQGAVLATHLLIQAYEKKLKADLLRNLKCCILIGGIGKPLPSNPELSDVFDYAQGRKKIDVPVLIAQGKNDGIVTMAQSQSLMNYFKDVDFWEHYGKHEVPIKGADINRYKCFMDKYLKEC